MLQDHFFYIHNTEKKMGLTKTDEGMWHCFVKGRNWKWKCKEKNKRNLSPHSAIQKCGGTGFKWYVNCT